MADNKFINTNWVSMEILRLLLNKLVVSENFSTDWQGDFNREFAPGATITAKLPWRPLVKDGMGYDPQGIDRITTTITLDQWLQIPFEWDDYERAVKLERSEEELRENYWEPCAAAMAQEMDSRAAKHAYQNASNLIGTLGTEPTLVGSFYSARQILMEEACPPGKRALIMSSSAMQSIGASTAAGSVVSMFHPGDEVTKMFKEGYLGRLAGFDVFESPSLWSHTAGTWGGAVTVNGANQSGTQIKITATAADTFKKGDKISFGAATTWVNRVNPLTRRISGKSSPRVFTVTQDLTAVGGGDAADVLNILPAIYGPGSQYQNVDILPVAGMALNLWGGAANALNGKVGTVGLGLSRYAFAKVGAKLYVPKAVESAGQATDPDTKLSVRKVTAWDPVRSMEIHRMDSLLGFGNLYQSNGAVAVAMG